VVLAASRWELLPTAGSSPDRDISIGQRSRFLVYRHIYGSLPVRAGALLPSVQSQTGYSSFQLTADTYTHLLPGGNVEFTERPDSTFARKISPQQSATHPQPTGDVGGVEIAEVLAGEWLGGRDSNPDTQIQRQRNVVHTHWSDWLFLTPVLSSFTVIMSVCFQTVVK
jgi:hypothetical protein